MKSLKLLSNKFKVIGFLLLAVTIPSIFLIGFISPQLKSQPELLKSIASILIMAGMALVIFSREKIEDEFIENCRLKSFAISFTVGIVSYIINEVFYIIDSDSSKTIFQSLFNQCLFYIVVFYMLKNNFIAKNEKQIKGN